MQPRFTARLLASLLTLTAVIAPAVAFAAPQPTPTPVVSPGATPSPEPSDEPTATPEPFIVPADVQAAVDALSTTKSEVIKLAQAEQAAWREVRDMQPVVEQASLDAEQSQDDLDDFARSAYMFGSPSTNQLIINSDDTDIADTLHGVGYVQSVSRDKGTQTALDLADAQQVQRTYSNRLGIAYAASLDHLYARQRVTMAEESLQRVAALSGPEMVSAVMAIGSLDESGCPTQAPQTAFIGISPAADVNAICKEAVAQAQTPQAKAAIQWAFTRLGSPYACQGVGRMNNFQADCSSLVSRAYEEGAGIITSVNGWAPTTHTMIPETHPNFRPIRDIDLQSGDLSLYYTCPEGEICTYNHVVMYLGVIDGIPLQLHTNSCGGVANLTPFWGTQDGDHGTYLGTRRVIPTDPNWVAPVVPVPGAPTPAYVFG